MARSQFERADFLAAARRLVAVGGPDAATVGSIAQELSAPVGSFYHRFASRDVLLAELWLETVVAFQEGFIPPLEAGDGLTAALHGPRWAREQLEAACLLLVHNQQDFVRGDWPETLREGVAAQGERLDRALRRFARSAFGSGSREALLRARFVVIDVPLAASRPHLRRHVPPPLVVDELIAITYRAVAGGGRK